MIDLFWLSDDQMERLRAVFPRTDSMPLVDDRLVLSGIVHRSASHVNERPLMGNWRSAPNDRNWV